MRAVAKRENTLLQFLKEQNPDHSMNSLRGWLKQGRVYVRGVMAKRHDLPVEVGDEVEVRAKGELLEGGIRVLFRDAHLIAIEKPAGLLSVATHFEKAQTAHDILKEAFAPRRLFVVHRLDRETSGVMLFAFTFEALERLKALFASHDIERHYVAVVEGILEEKTGTWRSYLYEDKNYHVHETADSNKGELAITHYRVLKEQRGFSQLDLRLETGKKNQIRVQAEKASHPIVGDLKYGGRRGRHGRLALHAYKLSLVHPVTKQRMNFETPFPDSLMI